MISTQMLKGVLEYCILKIIADNETYGYEIVQELKTIGFNEMTEGTVYPLLLRLEKNAWLKTEKRSSEVGPPRKYYQITHLGQNELNRFFKEWEILSQIIHQLFNDKQKEPK